MKKTFKFTQALVLVFVLILFSACQNDPTVEQPTKLIKNALQRQMNNSGKLIIENASDVDLFYSIMCIGTENDVPYDKYELFGENLTTKIVNGTSLELNSMDTRSTPGINRALAIDSWLFQNNADQTSAVYSGFEANNLYGQYFDPNNTSFGKFSIWKVVVLSTNDFNNGPCIPGEIEMKIELPNAENPTSTVSEIFGCVEIKARSTYTPNGDIIVNVTSTFL